MQRIQPHDRRSLRQFGIALAVMVALVLGVAAPWLLGRAIPRWPFALAGLLALLAILWPAALYPVHRLLRPPLAALATVNNWLLLGLVFFLVLWPYGAFARLTRRLHYVTGFDHRLASYRVERRGEARRDGPTDLDRPF